MKIELKFGDYLLIGSICHVVATVLSLSCYALGFGAQLGAVMTVSDIAYFAVSKMPTLYFSALISLAVAMIYNPYKKLDGPLSLSVVSGVVGVTGVLPAATEIALAYASNRSVELAWLFGLFLGAGALTFVLLDRAIPAIRSYRDFSLWFCVSVAAIACFSASDGHRDRYATFAQARTRSPSCGSAIMLARLSIGFIVVEPDGHKAIYTPECKRLADIAEPEWLH